MTEETKSEVPREPTNISSTDDDDDESEFDFTDEIHGQQEILLLSESLSALGFDVPEPRSHSNKALVEKAFEKGKQENLSKILDEIDRIGQHQARKGMREGNFTWGLLNCLVIAYTFGAHPAHFWIVYLFESIYWMGCKFFKAIRPPRRAASVTQPAPINEVLYFLDFCWVMNFLLVLVFMVLGATAHSGFLSLETRRQMYMGAYGIAAGPVFMAAMGLPFVAFLFHDTNTMANLIIHLLPSMLMYVARWHPEKVREAYPNMFRLSYVDEIPFRNVSWNATLVFFAWWVPYVCWMLAIGLSLPRKSDGATTRSTAPPKYDTVFHSLWRGGPCEAVGTLVWKRPKEVSRKQEELDDYEVRDFLLYISLHGLVCVGVGIHILARLCHASPVAHGACLWVAILICAMRGSKRYTYYTTSMYGQHIRKHFEKKVFEEQKKEK